MILYDFDMCNFLLSSKLRRKCFNINNIIYYVQFIFYVKLIKRKICYIC